VEQGGAVAQPQAAGTLGTARLVAPPGTSRKQGRDDRGKQPPPVLQVEGATVPAQQPAQMQSESGDPKEYIRTADTDGVPPARMQDRPQQDSMHDGVALAERMCLWKLECKVLHPDTGEHVRVQIEAPDLFDRVLMQHRS
jgi:hypothetical protein